MGHNGIGRCLCRSLITISKQKQAARACNSAIFISCKECCCQSYGHSRF